jgi:DNA-binding NarL/FixJ family response regulator
VYGLRHDSTYWGERVTGESGRILVVDSDPDFRALVAEVFERAGYEIREATSASEAVDAAQRETPNLVLVEVELPELSGYELCRELRELYGGKLPIVFTSAERVETLDRVAGLIIGADDYIIKPPALDELLARVRLLLRSTRGPSPSADPQQAYGLTARELEVLTLLAEGFTPGRVAAELVISSSTVATHIQRILTKLNVHTRGEAIAFAYRRGLVRHTDGGTRSK